MIYFARSTCAAAIIFTLGMDLTVAGADPDFTVLSAPGAPLPASQAAAPAKTRDQQLVDAVMGAGPWVDDAFIVTWFGPDALSQGRTRSISLTSNTGVFTTHFTHADPARSFGWRRSNLADQAASLPRADREHPDFFVDSPMRGRGKTKPEARKGRECFDFEFDAFNECQK